MEQLPDNGDNMNYKVTSYPTVATMKSEPQESDIRTLQDWHNPVITVKRESQEDSNPEDPELILPDWSYQNSESESEAEDPVTLEAAEWNFKARSVGREQLTSVVEPSLDTSIETEDFSIKTEQEENIVLFLDLRDREEEKEMVRGRIQELTFNQGDNVFKTDVLTFGCEDELTAAERGGQESSSHTKAEEFLCVGNTCRITDGSLCRSLEKEELVQDQENNEILKQNEDTGKELSICVIGWKDLRSGCSSKVNNIAYSSKTPYKCDLCRREPTESSNKGHHTSILSGQTPSCTCRKGNYECQYCGHRFTEKSNIRKHIQNVHLKQRLYECHECGQKFGENCDMKHHVKSVHLKMKEYDCHLCGKRFYRQDRMKNHVQIVHLKKKQYECQHCGQRFGIKFNLYKHIKMVHLKEKQYDCQHCGQMFGQSSDRNKHIRIVHLKDKQHECPHCGKRFGLKRTMTSHVQTVHLKEKLFKCEICGQNFGAKSNMRAHVKNVHLKIKSV